MGVVKCPKCGLVVSDTIGECFACGAVLPRLTEPDDTNIDSENLSSVQVSKQNIDLTESDAERLSENPQQNIKTEQVHDVKTNTPTNKFRSINKIKLSELVEDLRKYYKHIIAGIIILLIGILLIWFFVFHKPYKEALRQFETASNDYNIKYISYEAAIDDYNSKINTLKKEKEEAANASTSLKEILKDPQIEDEALINEMQNTLENSELQLADEIVAMPISASKQIAFNTEGLKTKEIIALIDEVRAEAVVIDEELNKVSEKNR